MKKTIITKETNKTYIYKLQSDILCWHYCQHDNFSSPKCSIDRLNKEEIIELSDYIEEEMKTMGSRGLAEYLDDDLDSIIKSIIVTIQNNKAIAIVEALKELSQDDLNNVKYYIIGQYADGWGEGFEQKPFISYNHELEFYDEDEHEYYVENSEMEIYATFFGEGITYHWT